MVGYGDATTSYNVDGYIDNSTTSSIFHDSSEYFSITQVTSFNDELYEIDKMIIRVLHNAQTRTTWVQPRVIKPRKPIIRCYTPILQYKHKRENIGSKNYQKRGT